MLNGFANRDEQPQAGFRVKLLLVAKFVDRNSVDILHHEIRRAVSRDSSIDHSGDVNVVHHRQRLLFGFESRDDVAVEHA